METNFNKETNSQQLQFVVIPQIELDIIKEKLNNMERLLTTKIEEQAKGIYVESEVARKELGICPRTWQSYRDSRVIPFCQFGRKIYVMRSDIHKFIEAHRVN